MFFLLLFEFQDFLCRFSHCLVETAEVGFLRFFLKSWNRFLNSSWNPALVCATFSLATSILLTLYSLILVLRSLMAHVAINSWWSLLIVPSRLEPVLPLAMRWWSIWLAQESVTIVVDVTTPLLPCDLAQPSLSFPSRPLKSPIIQRPSCDNTS